MKQKILSIVGAFGILFGMLMVQVVSVFLMEIIILIVQIGIGAKEGLTTDVIVPEAMKKVDGIVNANTYILMFIATVITLIITAFVYKKLTKNEPKVRYNEAFKLQDIIVLLIMGIGAQSLIVGLLHYILQLPIMAAIAEDYTQVIDSIIGTNILISMLLTIIVAPFSEELIFRGIILRYSRKEFPFFLANFLQALLFALYHGNKVQGAYAFFFGLLFGYIYKKYKTIFIPIILHSFINASAYLLALQTEYFFEHGGMLILLILGLILMTGCFFYLWKKPDCGYESE